MFRFRKTVYCDNNATTKVSKGVQKVMAAVLARAYANPSSPYKMAHDAANILSDARRSLASAINAPIESIIFTSCATESNNTLKSIAQLLAKDKRTIIYNPLEHPAMLETLFSLREQGFHLIPLPSDRNGRISLDNLQKLWRSDVGLVVCMLANNEIGTVYNIKAFTTFAHEHGAVVFSDMVQALGKVAIDLQDCAVDYASFSAHKIHGPKGIGALYVRDGAPFAPFMVGGHQEDARRAGTESLHNIAGFAAAAEDIGLLLQASKGLRQRRDALEAHLRKIAPDCIINSPAADECLANTISVTFPNRANALLMGQLDYYGISVAAGSACNTGDDMPSHVLLAIGLTPAEARSTLRISLAHDYSEADLRYTMAIFTDILTDKASTITAIQPSKLSPEVFFAPDIFIIDLRRSFKKDYKLKALPNSKRFIFSEVKRRLDEIPKDKHILVTCEVGGDAPITAYFLKRKGYKRLSFLAWGLLGWKLSNLETYERFANKE